MYLLFQQCCQLFLFRGLIDSKVLFRLTDAKSTTLTINLPKARKVIIQAQFSKLHFLQKKELNVLCMSYFTTNNTFVMGPNKYYINTSIMMLTFKYMLAYLL